MNLAKNPMRYGACLRNITVVEHLFRKFSRTKEIACFKGDFSQQRSIYKSIAALQL
jgi:hypothetical protein